MSSEWWVPACAAAYRGRPVMMANSPEWTAQSSASALYVWTSSFTTSRWPCWHAVANIQFSRSLRTQGPTEKEWNTLFYFYIYIYIHNIQLTKNKHLLFFGITCTDESCEIRHRICIKGIVAEKKKKVLCRTCTHAQAKKVLGPIPFLPLSPSPFSILFWLEG